MELGESDVEGEGEKGSKENLQVPNCRTGWTVEDGQTWERLGLGLDGWVQGTILDMLC